MSSENKSSEPVPQALSARVKSSQRGVHPQLEDRLRRHLNSAWREPLHVPTVEAFGQLQCLLESGEEKRLVFDSGCGTGASTLNLGRSQPQDVVIGIDQSAARLAKGGHKSHPVREGNCIWVRAELASLWRLALDTGWRLKNHYLFYPNPWPKAAHLQRRWHAHPVFPAMLALGGALELRCNWRIYADEFAAAVKTVTGRNVEVEILKDVKTDGEAASPFERKYRASGHDLFRVSVPVDATGSFRMTYLENVASSTNTL